jgi:hypothetical protein
MITVTLTSWDVPFAHIVDEVKTFSSEAEALNYVNAASAAWWRKNNGERCVAEGGGAKIGFNEVTEYSTVDSLLDTPHYTLWGGENGFQAFINKDAYWQLHAAYYKREYTDKGEPLPGYLRVAMGEDVSKIIAELKEFFKPRN